MAAKRKTKTMKTVYVVDGSRSPFLKAKGKPGAFNAANLSVAAARPLLARMPFSPTEIDEVIAFLDWCGKVDLNGFPADPPLKSMTSPVVTTGAGDSAAPETFASICVACHSVGGQGGNIGPALDDVRQRKNRNDAFRATGF